MEYKFNNTQSSINISQDVILTIASETIKSIDGVKSLGNLPIRVGVFTPAQSLTPINFIIKNETAQIEIGIVVLSNHRINDVCKKVQKLIKEDVQSMTGIVVSKVNIYVAGVFFNNN